MSEPPVPRLSALATAAPDFILRQEDVAAAGCALFDVTFTCTDRLMPVHANAGVEKRRSCVPLAWFLEEYAFSERNRLHQTHAVILLAQAADRCLDHAGLTHADVDMLVMVSTSGIATPSLDALLMEQRPFRRDVPAAFPASRAPPPGRKVRRDHAPLPLRGALQPDIPSGRPVQEQPCRNGHVRRRP